MGRGTRKLKEVEHWQIGRQVWSRQYYGASPWGHNCRECDFISITSTTSPETSVERTSTSTKCAHACRQLTIDLHCVRLTEAAMTNCLRPLTIVLIFFSIKRQLQYKDEGDGHKVHSNKPFRIASECTRANVFVGLSCKTVDCLAYLRQTRLITKLMITFVVAR